MESSVCKRARISVGKMVEGAREVSMQCEVKIHGGSDQEQVQAHENAACDEHKEFRGEMHCNLKIVHAHDCPCFESRS